MDELATFVERKAAWCVNGQPRSWRHFVYGMTNLGREEVRRTLRDAASARIGQATESAYVEARRYLKRVSD